MRVTVHTPEEFNALCSMREAEGVFETSDAIRYLTVRPHGIFLTDKDRVTDVVSLSFLRKLPLIPALLLEDIIAYFREDLSLEAAVRICYDEKKGQYFFVKAGGYAGGAFITYDYSDSMEEILRDGVICVMDVHSHNRMTAFWSCVDDADELMSPGALYGVIGRLQEDRPRMRFRAVMRGSEVALNTSDLFDVPNVDSNLANVLSHAEHNQGLWKGKAFWIGAFDLSEGKIVEVHTWEECEKLNLPCDLLFGTGRYKFQTGEWILFTLEEFGCYDNAFRSRDVALGPKIILYPELYENWDIGTGISKVLLAGAKTMITDELADAFLVP